MSVLQGQYLWRRGLVKSFVWLAPHWMVHLPENALKATASVSEFMADINSDDCLCVEFYINVNYTNDLKAQKKASAVSESLLPILMIGDADEILLDDCKFLINKAAQSVLKSIPVYFSDENSFSDKVKKVSHFK